VATAAAALLGLHQFCCVCIAPAPLNKIQRGAIQVCDLIKGPQQSEEPKSRRMPEFFNASGPVGLGTVVTRVTKAWVFRLAEATRNAQHDWMVWLEFGPAGIPPGNERLQTPSVSAIRAGADELSTKAALT